MEKYRVSKILTTTKKWKMIVAYGLSAGNKKGVTVKGDLPELCEGMIISLELGKTTGKGIYSVTDYAVELTARNISVLSNRGIDTERYASMLTRHKEVKKDGLSWDIANIAPDKVYEALSFREADAIHKKQINDALALERVRAINKEVLLRARNLKKIEYELPDYIALVESVEKDGAYEALSLHHKVEMIAGDEVAFRNGKLHDTEMENKVSYVNQNMRYRASLRQSLLSKEQIQCFIDALENNTLAQEQIDVLWCLQNRQPCIVTGGAGTGKTTVIKTLLDGYMTVRKQSEILLVAPTGKASVRLESSTSFPASTIHGALRKSVDAGFTYYHQNNKLPYKLIIVDESSMIDTGLMYDLLMATESDCKIIFVGDHNQLRPVGYGEPFFDFMDMLPVYRLTENHRQSDDTDILANAFNALENKPLFSGRGVTVKDIEYDDIPSLVYVDDSVQILSQYREVNHNINFYLKNGENEFNVGDKVIMTSNTLDFCNGDIGYIVKIDRSGYHIMLDDMTLKTVVIDGEMRIVSENKPRTVVVSKKAYFELAYAITVHKMQGSEADKIIVFLKKGTTDKSMLYTAVTRAKKELEIYYY